MTLENTVLVVLWAVSMAAVWFLGGPEMGVVAVVAIVAGGVLGIVCRGRR